MSDHALLAPSSAKRWLNCTPSARLEEQFPDSESIHAAEGTLAHSIAELRIRKHFLEPMGARAFTNRLKPFKGDPLFQEEMLAHTEAYLDYIKGIAMRYPTPPHVIVEKVLDLGEYVPESFGKCDCILLTGHDLHVIDFKYGKSPNGRVLADENPQMMLYALGALRHYVPFYDIKAVHLHIFQPRLTDGVNTWSLPVEALHMWSMSIQPAAQQAFKGEGEYCPGDWCHFCRAKANCRSNADAQLALAGFSLRKPPLLTDTEVGEALTQGRRLQEWLEALETYALGALLDGAEIPGWKAVEGYSRREFNDTDAAFAAVIAAGYDKSLLYEHKPITLAGVEKLLGKPKFGELLSEYVEKPKGKPALAEQSDKREPYSTIVKAEDVFTKL